jgi:hypothetical protein
MASLEDVQHALELVARALNLMREALLLLDQTSARQSAALLDHAIAVLPVTG